MVSGVDCEMIEGTGLGDGDGRITLWVDETGAIRKYVQESTIDPPKLADLPGIPKERAEMMRTEAKYRSTTTFVFEPEFDVELAPEETSFTPPAG